MPYPTLYATWQPLPRPRFFPSDPDLNRLLDGFSPRVGQFELQLRRREARDLRKGLFGPKGTRNLPKACGMQTFDLPNGWTVRLTYREKQAFRGEPGDVVAEFIPPPKGGRPLTRRELGRPAAHPTNVVEV
jgi:hypothetical protein